MGDGEVPLLSVQWIFLLSSKPGSGTKNIAVTGLTIGGKKKEIRCPKMLRCRQTLCLF